FSPSKFSPKGLAEMPVKAFWMSPFLGDPSEEDAPVPIPNTAGKLLSPDGTARASVWESRTSPGFNSKRLIQRPSLRRGPFVFFLTLFPPISFARPFRPVLYSNRVLTNFRNKPGRV